MSHFLILRDGPEQRSAIRAAVLNDLSIFPELRPLAWEYRDTLVVQALMDDAPQDQHQSEDGFACLWGARPLMLTATRSRLGN